LNIKRKSKDSSSLAEGSFDFFIDKLDGSYLEWTIDEAVPP